MTKKEREFLTNWISDFELEIKRMEKMEKEGEILDSFFVGFILTLIICAFIILELPAHGSILAIVYVVNKVVKKVLSVKRNLNERNS